MKKSQKSHSALRARLRRLSNVHILVIVAIVAQIIIFDAGKLIPPETVLNRWIITTVFTAIVGCVWYSSRGQATSPTTLVRSTWVLIIADVAMASSVVYSQRGMASRAVALYALPIIVATALERRRSLVLTALLCAITYLTTCVAYFVLHFNEGYKLELYGEAGFYAVIFVLFGLGLWATTKPQQ